MAAWKDAQNYFDNVSDPDLIEFAIYEMKAAQQTAASATEEQAGSEDGESTDEDDPTKTGTEPKKNRKLTDRVRDFFGRAPESAGADSDW